MSPTRRDFVQTGAAAVAGLALPVRPVFAARSPGRHAADTIRIGLIGCGGRGTGAVHDCITSSERIELVAIGDLFPDRLASCRAELAKAGAEEPGFAGHIKVTDDRAFSGFDAYAKVLASDIDLVVIATPPAFRPLHVAAAVDAGKHIFMEKPVAVDPAGVRSIIASSERAAVKGLAIVSGTQRRHQAAYIETIRRLADGAIGDIVAGQVYWNQGGLWMHPRKPEWTDMEWQLRNWLYFTWASGDHIVEQHIHNLDVANWVLGRHPVKAVGNGGRQWRTDPAYGHIYDHFSVDFDYGDGVHVHSMCRQIDATAAHVGEHFVGTKGEADPQGTIRQRGAAATEWRFEAPAEAVSPYVQEHADLIAGIRSGKLPNEGRRVAESTLTAILGREAAYTGREITWEEILNAPLDLVPKSPAFGPLPIAPVAIPGVTALDRTA